MLLPATRDATAGEAEASKLVASAVAPGMRGSVWDGKPGAMALTVAFAAEADAVARPLTVEDGDDEAVAAEELAGAGLCAALPVWPPQPATASAVATSTVAPASGRILTVMFAMRLVSAFRSRCKVPPSLVGGAAPPRLGWTGGNGR